MKDAPLSVLLVEDEPAHAEAILRSLRTSGTKSVVYVAGTLREYREAVAAHPPDIVLMDLVLPDGRALEALTFPAETGPFPILVMTSFGDEQTAVSAIKAGALDYVVKSPEAIAGMPHFVAHALQEWAVLQERRRAEAALRESEERFRTLYENSTLGLYRTTPDGRIVLANPALIKMLGYSSFDELSSRDLRTDGFEPSYPRVHFVETVEKEGAVRGLESAWRRRDRSTIFVRESAKAIRDSEGRTIYFDGTVEDITDRKRAEERLRQAVASTIRVISMMVEARDPYTAGHQLRTTILAEAIAVEMGLSPDKIEGLRMAGQVHDVGKISIPAEILSKPTRLTPGEFKLVKTHAEKGYEILKDVEFPWPVAEIVYQHHERMDGSGYPRGLKRDEILMEARILSLSDTVEAMAAHRPYRPAPGIDVALEEIEKNRGILYDPDVAAACLKLFRTKKFAFEG